MDDEQRIRRQIEHGPAFAKTFSEALAPRQVAVSIKIRFDSSAGWARSNQLNGTDIYLVWIPVWSKTERRRSR